MSTPSKTLIDLENKFWQSMVDQDTDTALQLLNNPALMVSSQGAMKFDHAGYRKMAELGSMVVTSFELSKIDGLLYLVGKNGCSVVRKHDVNLAQFE